ncbi:MAG TPA: hypothetical protein VF736_21850 [Pyrinomonadaceae bacterium]
MDINTLRDQLKAFEDRPGHRFSMPASQAAAWVAVHDLVAGACAAQTLTITGITGFPPDHVVDSVVYSGQATLLPWSPPPEIEPTPMQAVLAVTATFTVDGAGNPQLFIRAAAPSGAGPAWHLSDSLENLWETVFESVGFDTGAFFLTSFPTTLSTYPGTLQPGVNFLGVVSLAGAFVHTRALLSGVATRTVSGVVGLAPGAQPTLTLAPAATQPVTVGGVQLSVGARLRAWFKTFSAAGSDGWPIATAEVVAYLRLGSASQPLELRMPLLPTGGALTLSLGDGTQALAGWSDLKGLSGGVNLGSLIPADVPAARRLTLKGLNLFLQFDDDGALPSVTAVSFDVALDTSAWAVLPNNIMALNEVGAQLRVDFLTAGGPSASAVLYGRFNFVEVIDLLATVSIPSLNVAVSLDHGTQVSVADVMDEFMKKLTGRSYRPPVDMSITRLDLGVSVRTGEFQFSGDIETDWSASFGSYNGGSLVTLSFDGIQFGIEYDGQKLAGVITAFTTVNGVQFYVRAGTEGGPDAGWTIGAGIQPGSRIKVLDLLTSFMFPRGNAPGGGYGIPSLDITALDLSLSLDPDNTPYLFDVSGVSEGSWDFQVFQGSGPTLRLSVQFRVGGRKLLGPNHRVAPNAEWSIAGDISGTLTLFGVRVTAGYEFDANNSTLRFGIWYGARGIEATVTQKPRDRRLPLSPKDTILTVRLGDLSLGEILEFLLDLAIPGGVRRLPSPWDVLYQINFKDLSLVVNLTTNDVEVRYDINLNLAFARLDTVGLVYKNVNGAGRVYIQLYGDFLGQPYGKDNEPLSWDVVNEDAPDVPGQGGKLVNVRYVGFGQHVALSTPDSRLKTVEAVIGALKAAMKPVSGQGNPLSDPAAAALRYDGNSKWLFGLDATILDTLSLSAVFYDPHLYGALIELAGERAGALAGLRFELIYRRITADIGEFSIDLRVPDQFRNWEFGEVSVTLGLIHVDIYTNGNFRIDAGFPHNQDFSVSFSVQVFPFIGQGGFYFAYLTGATSERVPAATNGVFSPVIEAGVGLAVGLGKEFSKGPLKAELSVELYGIFEGVFAPFHPYDPALPKENYFWFQGTAGIVGKLYGSVDFVVVKASVSLVARASATIVIESHEPTQISLHLSVEAEASLTIVFFTVHFSFSLTIDESFTIGSHTAPPWIEGLSADNKAHNLLLAAHAPAPASAAQPRLRQQRPQRRQRVLARLRHARTRLAAFRTDPALHAGRARAALLAGGSDTRGAEASVPWPPVAVFGDGTPKKARVQFAPAFTIADPTTLHPPGPAGPNQMQVVLTLLAENNISPDAVTAEEAAKVETAHLHATDGDGAPGLALMVEAFFRWAASAGAGAHGAEKISLLQLDDILEDLADPAFQQATFAYENLTRFLNASLHMEVAGYPTGTLNSTSGTFVPIVPEITAAVTVAGQTSTRNFAAEPPVSPRYTENLAAYFEQLATDASANTAADPFAGAPAPPFAREPLTTPSLAKLIFSDYFALLTRAAVQSAIDLLSAYPYTYPASGGPSLAALAATFDGLIVPVALAKGQTLADVAAVTGIHPADLAAANPGHAGGADSALNLPVIVTALTIAQDNARAALDARTQFNVKRLPYQVRAGQTLNDIAAAAPRQVASGAGRANIDTPPSGVTVGQANAALPGLLRKGATLTIPSFTYTRLANDSDAFLVAFFKVRNQGVNAVENLDWYSQAVSTLNPGVDWSKLGGVQTIKVPTAYLNSAAAGAEYPIHRGDTLVRIAATFALFEKTNQYTSSPAGGSYTVPQMSHTIASTDIFANPVTDTGLVADFPGLALASLVGANAGADILTPLATLTLPDYGAAFAPDDTLSILAAAFDLSLADLVDLLKDTGSIFKPGAALTIHDVPSRSVDDLVADLKTSAHVNQVAAQLSRFLMYGLRIPAPDDQSFLSKTPPQVLAGDFTGSLYCMYDLTGQQFAWPDPAQSTANVTLTKSSAPWLTFVNTTTHDGGEVHPSVAALNPRLASATPAGVVLATETVDSLRLTIDNATFSNYLPSTTLTLGASAPQAMTLYDTSGVHLNLQANIHWQASARPRLPGGVIGTGQPGEPAIWPFTTQLRGVAEGAGAGTTPPYGLFSVPLDAPPGAGGVALGSYAWATTIPFNIRRVASTPPPQATPGQAATALGGRWLAQVYVVEGADQAGASLLYDLWVYLKRNAAAETATRLFLLYPPNATGSNPSGLASDAVNAADVYLLKTNLSTETHQPPLMNATLVRDAEGPQDTPPLYGAGLDHPADFVTFLWEATVIGTGGFYLHYRNGDAGLPDSIFDDEGRARVNLVCLLGSQSGGLTSGGGLLKVNNCAVVGDNVDAAAVQLYAAQTGPGAPTVKLANVPPGNVGFTILRTPPQTKFPDDGPAQRAGRLYNLTGFSLAARAPFGGSNEGLPVGSAPGRGADAGKWLYQQVFDAASRATAASRVEQNCPALPSTGGDPYAGISSTATAEVAFDAHDSFGNVAAATDPPPPLSIPFRYIDRVIGLGEWPGATTSYMVLPPAGAAAPSLAVTVGLQSSNYVPGPGLGSAAALYAASAHALRYERVFYQLNRPGVTLTAKTTLDGDSEAAPLPLSRARFAAFTSAAYVFVRQIAGLAPVEHTTTAGELLGGLVSTYSVTAADLLDANKDLLASSVLTGSLTVPRFEQARRGETLTQLAARAGLTVAALLAVGDNIHARVPAGASLAVNDRTFSTAEGQTLADMARAAGSTPGDIGEANATKVGLLADGLTLNVRGASVLTGGSTFQSLVTAYAALGVTTSPGEIATLNADIPNIFNTGSTTPVSYVVRSWTAPQATSIAEVVATQFAGSLPDFITKNAGTPGVAAESWRFQISSTTQTVPAAVTLRDYVGRVLGLSTAELAAANPNAALGSGAKLLIPALLNPARLSAVPYAVGARQSLDDIAGLFATTATQLGASNRDVGGVFVPGKQVTVGAFGSVATGAEDSLASLLLKFQPADRPTLDQLIAAVESSTTLLQAGAVLIVPAPTVPQAALSLSALATRFGLSDLQTFARVNASLDGLLNSALSVTLSGHTIPVGTHGTLAGLYARALAAGVEITFAGMVSALAGEGLLALGAKFLLPPPQVTASAALPANPTLSCAITSLATQVTIARPSNEVDPGFADTPGVAAATTSVPPFAAGDPASYLTFALSLEQAYGNRLRVAAGGPSAVVGSARQQRLYVVRFEAPGGTLVNAIRKVEIANTPNYFGLPPLSNELISREASIRSYKSGSDNPLPDDTERRVYQAVDVQGWAGDALAALDLVLSPAYAAGAFAVTRGVEGSTKFDDLVGAKGTLASKISAQLTGILRPVVSASAPAREALKQALEVSLTEGFTTDAVVELPTTVQAAFNNSSTPGQACADAGGHRFAGKAQSVGVPLDITTTLNALAQRYNVNVAAPARLLGTTPNILSTGATLQNGTHTWTIGQHDTLHDGVTALGLDSLDAFAVMFAAQAPLFRADVTVTIDGHSARTVNGSTLVSMADALDAGLGDMAVANQSVTGLLTGTLYVDGLPHVVTATTSSLAEMAASLTLGVAALAEAIAGQAVLAAGKTLHAVRWAPNYSLTAGKINLDRPSGQIEFLLNLKQRAQYRRLLVNLDFKLTGLEFDIAPAPFTTGYENSEWLQFIHPLGETPPTAATIDTAIGQLDIPVPLRAYPTPPRLVSQLARQTYEDSEINPTDPLATRLRKAEAWTYQAVFETDEAAQDVVYLRIGINFAPPPPLREQFVVRDPFTALAEFSANYPAIQTDLANLLLPPDVLAADENRRKKAKSAVEALAVIGQSIAANWGPVPPGPAAGAAGDDLVPKQSFAFRVETRTRSGSDGVQLLDGLVLTRTGDTATWGPDNQIPALGYVGADGVLHQLKPPTPTPGPPPPELFYRCEQEVAAFARRSYAVSYTDLDAPVYQNARASVWLTRNESLVAGTTTNPAFVYRTPEVHFNAVAVPSILRQGVFGIGAGAASGLAAAVTALFADLLRPTPQTATAQQSLTLRYGYRLAAPSGESGGGTITDDDIVSLTPVFFRPLFGYTDAVPGEIQDAVNAWLAANPPSPGQTALFSLDLGLFSTLLPGHPQPLVEFKRLDYTLPV